MNSVKHVTVTYYHSILWIKQTWGGKISTLLYQILVFIIHGKKFKKSYKNNNFIISTPTWNEEFELPDGSYSISDIQD